MKTLLFFALAAALPAACTLTMKVTEVHDGDTFRGQVLSRIGKCDGRSELAIRIGKIDAPELKQPRGQFAALMAHAVLHDRTVDVVISGQSYNRLVADKILMPTEPDVARRLVSEGLAWHYAPSRLQRLWRLGKMGARDTILAAAEKDARKNKRGIWSEPGNEAPWTYRERLKVGK